MDFAEYQKLVSTLNGRPTSKYQQKYLDTMHKRYYLSIMNAIKLQNEIDRICQDILLVEDIVAHVNVEKLLNIVEELVKEVKALEIERQVLRNEVNRLKGEQGKPNIKANKKKDGNISSEAERKLAEANAKKRSESSSEGEENKDGKKSRERDAKLPRIKIDREQICPLDKEGLPHDLQFKGYEDSIIQNIIIKSDNVKYRREVYYSPSERKSYVGELPEEVRGKGEYASGIRALIPILKTECNMSEKRILGFFHNFEIVVSATYISQQWTKGYEIFLQEKSELYRSGIAASGYVQIDDTSARVNGVNQYCQVVCSPLFTSYFTTEKKDRMSVLGVLTDFLPTSYLYNQHAQELLNTFKMPEKVCVALDTQLPSEVVMNETQFKEHLALLNNAIGVRQNSHITEACAIAFYQQQTEFPIISTLVADDAPQFKLLTENLSLCWIHDARHYKKLTPVVLTHQQALSDFQGQYWNYYTELLKYKQEPTSEKKALLEKQFDSIFTTITGYEDLDARIAKTLAKKTELLLVLEQPEVPLHNNEAELGARVQARVRDVSFQTRSEKGTKIKDAFMTINQTAKKLHVSFYDYVYDRVTGRFNLPSLAELILQKAQHPLLA
jgi:hypothetical protein